MFPGKYIEGRKHCLVYLKFESSILDIQLSSYFNYAISLLISWNFLYPLYLVGKQSAYINRYFRLNICPSNSHTFVSIGGLLCLFLKLTKAKKILKIWKNGIHPRIRAHGEVAVALILTLRKPIFDYSRFFWHQRESRNAHYCGI